MVAKRCFFDVANGGAGEDGAGVVASELNELLDARQEYTGVDCEQDLGDGSDEGDERFGC